MKTKTCLSCKIEKDVNCFSLDKRKVGRYKSQCKSCVSKKQIKLREKYIEINKSKLNKIINLKKKCSCCKESKALKLYSISNHTKDGYNHTCKDCAKEKAKYYNLENKEKVKLYRKEYRKINIESFKEKDKLRNINKKEQRKEYRIKNKEKFNEARKLKKLKDPLYKLKCDIRRLIQMSFKYKNNKKSNKTLEILGCSFSEFKLYLESRFELWMNWENRGKYNGKLNYGWDVDHIIPLKTAKTIQDIIRLNHYTNLQPLDSHINRDIKNDRIVY